MFLAGTSYDFYSLSVCKLYGGDSVTYLLSLAAGAG